MKLLKFIKENKDWREKLSQPPFSILIKEEEPYILLKYNQIESDMSNDIVKECRGIILKKEFGPSVISKDWCTNDLVEKYKVVRRAFDKFFNYGEVNAAEIDWSTAYVQEKVDGSLVSVWQDPDDKTWHLSTSGTIDAFKAPLGDGSIIKSFGELFLKAATPERLSRNVTLEEFVNNACIDNHTYTFELVSPYNRCVVPYKKTQIYLIGLRDEKGEELHLDKICDYGEYSLIRKPKHYPLHSIEDCIKATEAMGYDEEGFVVVDQNFNRIKIKSAQYVAAHYLKNNGVQTLPRLLKVVISNEIEEFIGYFPEYEKQLDAISYIYDSIIGALDKLNPLFDSDELHSQKDFAIWVQKYIKKSFQPYCYYARKNNSNATEWFNSLSESKQEELIRLWHEDVSNLSIKDEYEIEISVVEDCIYDYIKTLGTDWMAEWGMCSK